MKKWIGLAAAACLLSGCGVVHDLVLEQGIEGSGKSKTESRSVGEFDSLSLTGSPTVVWKKGDRQSVTVTCDDNLISLLKTDVKGGSLTIGFERSAQPKTDCRIEIVSPNVKAATLSGSGAMELSGLRSADFSATVTGSGRIKLIGEADRVDLESTGSGSIDATGIAAKNAKASTTGSGSLKLRASETVDASVTGSGGIEVYGNPQVDKRVTGSGNVYLK